MPGRLKNLAFAPLVTALALLFASAPAHAAKGTVAIWGSTGSGNGQLDRPEGIAVNHTSGDVYVAERFNGRVSVFDSSGTFLRAWGWNVVATGPGDSVDDSFEICIAANGDTCQSGAASTMAGGLAGGNGGPTGIAIDQSTGSVWVGDPARNRVQKFDALGNFILAFGDGVNQTTGGDVCTAVSGDVCQEGTAGSANGQFPERVGSQQQFAARLAVDQSTGGVYLADTGETSREDGLATKGGGNRRIQVFNASGQFVSTFGLPVGDLVLKQHYPAFEPFDLAIGSNGVLYTTQQSSPFSVGGNQVRALTTSGAPLGDFAAASLPTFPIDEGSPNGSFRRRGSNPTIVGVDPADDHVYVAQLNRTVPEGVAAGDPSLRWEIAEYNPAGGLIEEHALAIPEPNGLAVDPIRERIYTTSGEPSHVLVLDAVPDPPAATIASATEITSEDATLNGIVNPNGPGAVGKPTLYQFEYRKAGDSEWTSAPIVPVSVGEGAVAVPVSATISGLLPNQTYEVRLIAIREFGGGTDTSSIVTFTTNAVPPIVTTRRAFPIVDTSVTLRGVIDPMNAPTTYYFEYGLDTTYGFKAPAMQDGDAGGEFGPVPVYEAITGLQPETTYHYRVVAENTVGSSVGVDETFTTISTGAAAWPERGIELVNFPSQGNQFGLPFDEIELNDQAILWAIPATGGPGSSQGYNSPYLARRTATSWQSASLLPPTSQLLGGGTHEYTFLAITPDGTKVIYLVSFGRFAPYVVVLWDSQTRTQTVLAEGENQVYGGNLSVPFSSTTVNQDASRVVVLSNAPLVSGHPGDTQQLYEIGSGTPELIGRLPSNAVPLCGVAIRDSLVGFTGGSHPYEWISSDSEHDGDRVFFESQGNGCNGPTQVYRRDLSSDKTTLVSGPPTAGSSGDSFFLRASTDGEEVVYSSYTRLDSQDGNTGLDVYRWREGVGNECLTCVVADASVFRAGGQNGDRAVAVSPDFSYVYFASQKQLVPGEGAEFTGQGDLTNLYVLHNGALRYIAPHRGQLSIRTDPARILGYSRLAGSGRTLFFRSLYQLTPEPGTNHWYRYETESGHIECLDCLPLGTPPELAQVNELDVAADGHTAVFSTTAAFEPADVNRATDLYEWRDGRVRLLTDGITEWTNGPGEPALMWISRSGTNILFTAQPPLTGHEQDLTSQLYVARIGGGFPPPATPPAPCTEDACQGPLQSIPPNPEAGSAIFMGPGTQTRHRKKKKRAKRKQRGNKKSGWRKHRGQRKTRADNQRPKHRGRR